MTDLANRAGKYANVATYRLYKLDVFKPSYGHKFLSLDYIDLTDQADIDLIKTAPKNTNQMKKFQENVNKVLANHGVTEGTWYPTNMFEAWNSTYNRNCRIAAGYISDAVSIIQVGGSIYTKPTGTAENGGTVPEWIDQLYYGYQKNLTELKPVCQQISRSPARGQSKS